MAKLECRVLKRFREQKRMEVKHIAHIALLFVATMRIFVSAAMCLQEQPPSLPPSEWQLAIDLVPNEASIDVSRDRNFAIVRLKGHSEAKVTHRSRLIELKTGRTFGPVDFPDKDFSNLLDIAGPVGFSADGTHAAFVSKDDRCAILNLETKRAKFVRLPQYAKVIWSGNQLLISTHEGKVVETMDTAGRPTERLPLCGYVLASDSTGKKLLAYVRSGNPTKDEGDFDGWNKDLVVVTPDGEIVVVVAAEHTQCDKDEPVLSREGNYAGVYCWTEKMSEDWAYSLASTVTGEILRLDRMVGFNVAVTEHGDLIYLYPEDERWIVTFWPKHDNALRKAMDDASAPIHIDKFWTPFGTTNKILQLSNAVLAATVLGDEIFTIECPAGKPIVKAYPLPNLQHGPAPIPKDRN